MATARDDQPVTTARRLIGAPRQHGAIYETGMAPNVDGCLSRPAGAPFLPLNSLRVVGSHSRSSAGRVTWAAKVRDASRPRESRDAQFGPTAASCAAPCPERSHSHV